MNLERYHLAMRAWTIGVIGLLALTAVGCQGKEAVKSEFDTGLKELKKIDEKVGAGREVVAGDTVYVLYRGTLLKNGSQFDANMDDPTAAAPFSFTAGPTGSVIKGWQDGIVGMKEGGRRILEIPHAQGYGAAGSGEKIPPNADLKFEIELLYVLKESERGVYDVSDQKVGTGAEVKEGDTVTIEYKGTYLSGKVFDDSRERGEPLVFKVEDSPEAMPGLIVGIQGMKVGGKRTLVLPPDLAFGLAGTESVQGNQPIKIEIDLIKVNGKS